MHLRNEQVKILGGTIYFTVDGTSNKNSHRFCKGKLISALETFCSSPSTYRKINNSGELILLCERTLRKYLANPFDDDTLKKIFSILQAKQRLVKYYI